MLSSRSFTVSAFKIKSLIPFESIIYGWCKIDICFILQHVALRFPNSIYQRDCPSPLSGLGSFAVNWPYMCGFISGLSCSVDVIKKKKKTPFHTVVVSIAL